MTQNFFINMFINPGEVYLFKKSYSYLSG